MSHTINTWLQQLAGGNLLGRLIGIVGALVVGNLIIRISKRVVDRVFTQLSTSGQINPKERRIQTMAVLLHSVVRYTVDFVVIVVILSALGVNVGVLLAGVSVVGVAVGLGAQSLIKDIINGFFIIMENQYLVGEYITSGTFEGVVEEIGLRITRLRGFSGDVHIIPNGQIGPITNHSRGDMRVLVDVTVPFEADVERIEQVLKACCTAFAERHAAVLVAGPTVLGVRSQTEAEITFQLFAKTQNGAQWQTERDLRKAAITALLESGVPAPYTKHVMVPHELAGRSKG